MEKGRIAFLGGGQMGEAMIAGILAKGLYPAASISLYEPVPARAQELVSRYGIASCADPIAAISGALVVVVAVKPQVVEKALSPLKGSFATGACLLSIAAGISMKRLAECSGHADVVRAMPNTPARIGRGMSVWIASTGLPQEKRDRVRPVLAAMGDELEAGDESYIDKATAVSGSGPAYAFLFIEALADAAVHLGFSRADALLLASRTVAGAAEQLVMSGEHPAVLRNAVTSPAGTTAAALYRLEREGLRGAVSRAVWDAYERARELGEGKPASSPPN